MYAPRAQSTTPTKPISTTTIPKSYNKKISNKLLAIKHPNNATRNNKNTNNKNGDRFKNGKAINKTVDLFSNRIGIKRNSNFGFITFKE